MRNLAFVAMLLLCGASALPAAAQPKGAAADALFEEGRKAMDAKDYVTACDKFRESHRIDPAPGTMLNLARCEESRGKLATASELYRRVLDDLKESDERYGLARKRVDALSPRIPKLTVKLRSNAPSSTIVRMGEMELGAASLGVALPVDPGKVRVEVKAEGRAPRVFEIDIAESENKDLDVEPGAVSQTDSPSEPPKSDGSSQRSLGWIAGGIGVAGLAVGAVTGIMALGKKKDVDANCDADKWCTQSGTDAAHDGKKLGQLSTAGWIVGAVGIGAGAILILTSPSKTGAQSALQVSPAVGGAMLGWSRTW
jgi:hypothetical protein